MMTNKCLGVAALACLAASAVPFWLWKLYIIAGPSVRVLVWLFLSSFGAALVLGFACVCREIFRTARNWIGRGFQVGILLGGVAMMALSAALAMNFVGQ